jgi:hypothetical protein
LIFDVKWLNLDIGLYLTLCLQGTQGKFNDSRIQKRARVLHWDSIAIHHSQRD